MVSFELLVEYGPSNIEGTQKRRLEVKVLCPVQGSMLVCGKLGVEGYTPRNRY